LENSNELMPEMGAPFGVAVSTFFFDPHGSRQDRIRGLCRYGRVGLGNDNEVLGISITGVRLFVHIRRGLKVIVDLNPVGVEFAVAQHAVLQYGMISGLRRDRAHFHRNVCRDDSCLRCVEFPIRKILVDHRTCGRTKDESMLRGDGSKTLCWR